MAENELPQHGTLTFFKRNDGSYALVSPGDPLPVTASVSASIAQFAPKGKTTLAVSNASARVALPTADVSAIIRNIGSTDCFIQFGSAAVTASTTTSFLLKAGDAMCFDVTGQADIAAITASSTTTLEIWTGTGAGFVAQAGGSGGSGGNVNLNQVGGAAYALGQALKAASLSVTIASDQGNLPTNIAQVGGASIALGAAAKAASLPVTIATDQPPAGDRLEVTGSTSSASVYSGFPIADTTGYRSAAVQLTSAGTSCTSVAEESNDGTTWTQLQSTGGISALTVAGLYVFNLTAKQFRLRVSVYTSGTPAATVELRVAPAPVGEDKGQGATGALTQRMVLASDDPAVAVLGATSGAKVITDANGTIQQYLRGIVTLLIGTLTTTLAAGANVIGAVTQSGSWVLSAGSALIGKVGLDQTTPGTTNAVAISTLGATAIDTNAGNKSAGTQRVTLASDDLAVSVLGATSGTKVITDAAGTIQQYLRGIVTILIGSLTVILSTFAATGGAARHRLISAATTNATSVKGAAGRVADLQAFNHSTSNRYLKFYDKASAPTVGTDTPIATFTIPPALNAGQVGGITPPLPIGIQFATGIAYAITGALADADTTAIGAADVVVNLGYV